MGLGGLGGSFFGGSGDILIKVGADVGGAVSDLGKVNKSLDETQSTGQKVQAGIKSAAVPAAAALTGLAAAGIACVKSAALAEESQAKLNDQIKRSTGASDAAIKSTDEWVGSYGRTVAMTKGELNPALAELVRATGDVAKAQDLLKLSADVSAATGKDLASVTKAVGKAYNGSAGSLKRLVPSISDAAIKSGKWSKIQAELNGQVGGAAAKSAKTTEGQYKILQNTMKGLQVTIGLALLPAFQSMIGIMQPLADLAKEHASIFLILGGTIAALSAAVLIVNAAMAVAAAATSAWAAAQWILNAAMSANPIGLIVLAVAALAVGIVVAYRHSATFRAIVGGAFDACKKAGLLMLAPIKAFGGLLQSAWGYAKQFGSIASAAFRIVRQYGVLMLGPIGLWIKMIQIAWQHSATFRQITVAAFDAVKAAIQAVIDAISSVIGAIGRIHFPSKPSWLPLSAGYSVPAPYLSAGGLAAETGSGMVVHVSVSGAIDPEATAIQIRRILERYDRRRGRRPLGGETGPT
jgi:hypothetical protein